MRNRVGPKENGVQPRTTVGKIWGGVFLVAGAAVIAACGGADAGEANEVAVTETATTAPDPTTTSLPTTTTTPLPFIRTGTYAVPDEVAPGTYRHWGNAAVRLDENMEIIEHYLVANPGFGIVIVQPTDSFISVGDWIITVDDFGRPIDPIAEGLIAGVYLVGYDLEPGRYEVLPGDHPEDPYWARLDDAMEIIDSGTGVGIQEVIVEASDFALEFKGSLRLIP